MLHSSAKSVLFCFKYIKNNQCIYRYVRNVPGNTSGRKLLRGHVKTINETENDFLDADNFDDFKSKMKRYFVEDDELEMEKALTNDEDYSFLVTKGTEMHDLNLMDEKQLNRKMKLNNIKRQFFKNERETNLLTCAAKKQIKYLHQLDPIEWSPQRLSESFPISISGVKKLLKNNFEQHTCPEKIKEHDDQVIRKWNILRSGNFSPEISLITQKLWKEGKLPQENFAGNSMIPSSPEKSIDVKLEKKEVGEHLAIVHKFAQYKKNQIQLMSEQNSKSKTGAKDNSKLDDESKQVKKDILPKLRLRYPSADELEDKKSASYLASKKPENWEPEIPYSQFELNFKDELKMKKSKTAVNKEFQSWMEKEKAEYEMQTPKRPYNPSEFFTKIQKYEKKSVEVNKDYDRDGQPVAYYYDEHLGYQHPMGRTTKSKVKIPTQKYKKGSLYQHKQSVYDDNGEFLYRLPTNKYNE